MVDLVLMIVAYLGISALLFAAATLLGLVGTERSQLNTNLVITSVVNLVVVALGLWLMRHRGGRPAELGFRPLPLRKLYIPLLGFIGSLPLFLAYLWFARGMQGLRPEEGSQAAAFDSPATVLLSIVSVVIIGPFAEEIIFRGFLFGGLRRWLPVWGAILVSGLLFGALHFSPLIVIMGIVLAIVYVSTGTLYARMLTHFLYNATNFLVPLLVGLL
jgi:membrane protease YdiL (CAAX protease family)